MDPYAETTHFYLMLRRELTLLVGACMGAGWLLHTPSGVPLDQVRLNQS